jgi:hypothetical protein
MRLWTFNNWIREDKALHLDDLMDRIRQKLMVKWNNRRKIARQMDGTILPPILKKLKEESKNIDMEVISGKIRDRL